MVISNIVKAKDERNVCFNNYPPYHYMENNSPSGIAVEIANRVALSLGIKIKYQLLPWSRCLMYAKSGKVDAILFIFKKKEREDFLYYHKENLIAHEVNALYALNNKDISFNGDIENDLKSYTIGIIQDFSYGNTFDNASKTLTLDTVTDAPKLLKKLILGRNDCILYNTLLTNWYSRKMGIQGKIKRIDPPVSIEPGYIAFSKKAETEVLSKQFAVGMSLFKQSDQYAQVLEKYGAKKH